MSPDRSSAAGQNVAVANSEVTIDGDVVRKRYLRTDWDQPEREWTTLVLLHERAPGLAPRPIVRESEPPAVVVSRVAGDPFDAVLTPMQTSAMLTAYRLLFAVPVPPDLPLRFRHPAEFFAKNVGWLAEMNRNSLPDVVRRALEAAEQWHADALTGIDEVRDPVVVQGDCNIENMLWDGERVRLVDFEYSGVGDLAFEVADLVEHASSRLRGLLDPETVIAGFDLTAAQRARVEAYRIVLAAFWLLTLLPGSPGHGINPEGSTEKQAQHLLSLLGARSRQESPNWPRP
ncbi:MAG: hypothetical protein JWR35_64 [Marmoricola sp.]|nr:hypothetical protein [Marmoricola sp.]